MYRKENEDLALTKEMLSELCNVNRNTITRWDNLMIKNNMMTKDGYFYVVKLFDKKGHVLGYELTDKYEYQSYIRNNKYVKKQNEILEKYKRGEIDKDLVKLALSGIEDYAKQNENKFVYRVNKYMLAKDNTLLNQLIEIIRNTLEQKEYRQNYLENMKYTNIR